MSQEVGAASTFGDDLADLPDSELAERADAYLSRVESRHEGRAEAYLRESEAWYKGQADAYLGFPESWGNDGDD